MGNSMLKLLAANITNWSPKARKYLEEHEEYDAIAVGRTPRWQEGGGCGEAQDGRPGLQQLLGTGELHGGRGVPAAGRPFL